MPTPAALQRLHQLAWTFGSDAASEKTALITEVAAHDFARPKDLVRFHELLCLWRAYPDDQTVLRTVERVLASFDRRPDVRRHRDALENSGIAGSDIVYPFGAPTARWLAATVPDRMTIAWDRLDDTSRLGGHLLLMAREAEVPGFDEPPIADPKRWLGRLAGRGTDAAFIATTLGGLDAAPLVRDRLFDELDLPIRVAAGADGPSRTHAHWSRGRGAFQPDSLRPGRPDIRREVSRRPRVRAVSTRDARRLIHLAHESMVTRERDLDAFASADPADVRIVDCDNGLQFACLGVVPERRFLLEAVYAFLTLRNGVPIGYALASALFDSSELAFNVFETFRGGEAAWIYARLIATVRTMFGSDTFAIYPYQLGHENDEGLQSGAWWFYYKLGFRPRETRVAPLVDRELARLAARAQYRSSPSTLKRLVRHHMFLSLGRERDDVIGVLPMDRVGLAVTDYLAGRFGNDRRGGAERCADEVAALLGVASWRRLPPGERMMWLRWAPLVSALQQVHKWTLSDRERLAAAIRAKGSRRESDAVPMLTAHRPFRRALLRLAQDVRHTA
jgi:hypothetical protein